jgi:hypothetical protein
VFEFTAPRGLAHPRHCTRGVTFKRSSRIRCHHLIKTFYRGPGGWTDQQLPDGTIIFTAPTGHTYTTEPLGAMLFPVLKQSTGELNVAPTVDVAETDRALMMPRRKQTREQDRRDRILQERRQLRTTTLLKQRTPRSRYSPNWVGSGPPHPSTQRSTRPASAPPRAVVRPASSIGLWLTQSHVCYALSLSPWPPSVCSPVAGIPPARTSRRR